MRLSDPPTLIMFYVYRTISDPKVHGQFILMFQKILTKKKRIPFLISRCQQITILAKAQAVNTNIFSLFEFLGKAPGS